MDERTVQAVISAWNNPGKVPEHYEKMKRKLRKEWPVLAKAVEKLAQSK